MDKSELEFLVSQQLSIAKIAKRKGKSKTSIIYWMKKHGVSPFFGNHGKILCEKSPLCSYCGEEDAQNFYGHKKTICSKCHNEYTLKLGQNKREYMLTKLGGKCVECGYCVHSCSLDVHHIDPKKKDPNFSGNRGWSKKRLDEEMENCELLCKNCHAAVHAGKINRSVVQR